MAKETLITFINNPLTQLNEMLSSEYPDIMPKVDIMFTAHHKVKSVVIHQTSEGRYEIIIPTHYRQWLRLKPITLERVIVDICVGISTIVATSMKERYNCHMRLLQRFNKYSEESANAIIGEILNKHNYTTVEDVFDL